MRYFAGERISELTKLSLRELQENICFDTDDYIERHKLFKDGDYSIVVPFTNGESVRGKLIIRDIDVKIVFDKDAVIVGRAQRKWIY